MTQLVTLEKPQDWGLGQDGVMFSGESDCPAFRVLYCICPWTNVRASFSLKAHSFHILYLQSNKNFIPIQSLISIILAGVPGKFHLLVSNRFLLRLPPPPSTKHLLNKFNLYQRYPFLSLCVLVVRMLRRCCIQIFKQKRAELARIDIGHGLAQSDPALPRSNSAHQSTQDCLLGRPTLLMRH
jgi:hypothetical protein